MFMEVSGEEDGTTTSTTTGGEATSVVMRGESSFMDDVGGLVVVSSVGDCSVGDDGPSVDTRGCFFKFSNVTGST